MLFRYLIILDVFRSNLYGLLVVPFEFFNRTFFRHWPMTFKKSVFDVST